MEAVRTNREQRTQRRTQELKTRDHDGSKLFPLSAQSLSFLTSLIHSLQLPRSLSPCLYPHVSPAELHLLHLWLNSSRRLIDWELSFMSVLHVALQFVLSGEAVISAVLASYHVARELLSTEAMNNFVVANQVRRSFESVLAVGCSTRVFPLFLAEMLFVEVRLKVRTPIVNVSAFRDRTSK